MLCMLSKGDRRIVFHVRGSFFVDFDFDFDFDLDFDLDLDFDYTAIVFNSPVRSLKASIKASILSTFAGIEVQ